MTSPISIQQIIQAVEEAKFEGRVVEEMPKDNEGYNYPGAVQENWRDLIDAAVFIQALQKLEKESV